MPSVVNLQVLQLDIYGKQEVWNGESKHLPFVHYVLSRDDIDIMLNVHIGSTFYEWLLFHLLKQNSVACKAVTIKHYGLFFTGYFLYTV